MKKLNTLSEVGFALGVSKQTVSDWRRSGCPHLKQKPFDPDAVIKWVNANTDQTMTRRKRSDAALSLIERKQIAEVKLKELQAENLEFRNAIDRGELVYVTDTQTALAKQAEIFKRELSNLENQYVDRIINLKTRDQSTALLHEMTTTILRRLYKNVG